VLFDFMFQLNASFVYYIFSYSSTCFEQYCAHHQEEPLYTHSPLTTCALSGHLRRVTYKEPDAVCIQ